MGPSRYRLEAVKEALRDFLIFWKHFQVLEKIGHEGGRGDARRTQRRYGMVDGRMVAATKGQDGGTRRAQSLAGRFRWARSRTADPETFTTVTDLRTRMPPRAAVCEGRALMRRWCGLGGHLAGLIGSPGAPRDAWRACYGKGVVAEAGDETSLALHLEPLGIPSQTKQGPVMRMKSWRPSRA
jgi:hypothetical protein